MEKYQEQPQLLDIHLKQIVQLLMDEARSIVQAHEKEIRINLDSHKAFPFQIYHNPHFHNIMRVVYFLCKIRGHKTIVKFFSHEVVDFEATFHMLQSQDSGDHK